MEQIEHIDREHERRRQVKAALTSLGGMALLFSSELVPRHYTPLDGLDKGLLAGSSYLVIRGFMTHTSAVKRIQLLDRQEAESEE
jgi:hypothetical protein